jgi:glucose/arabinose dehydrogenase
VKPFAPVLIDLVLVACGGPARLPLEAGIGPNPQLPPPENAVVPAVKVSKATGWPAGVTPAAAPGLKVNPFAVGLNHPRWIYTLPNGDVLVAETSGPGRHSSANTAAGTVSRRVAIKVVFMPFGGAQTSGRPIDVLTGFIGGGKAFGRPVGVQIARDGSLLVADDVGDSVWRVSAARG